MLQKTVSDQKLLPILKLSKVQYFLAITLKKVVSSIVHLVYDDVRKFLLWRHIMPNGDPIYYHVHKILEALDLDREAYPDKETIRQLEYILIHLLLTEGPRCSDYRDRIPGLELLVKSG